MMAQHNFSTFSTVLKTAIHLKFCYIKLKNAKQKEEEEKKIEFLSK